LQEKSAPCPYLAPKPSRRLALFLLTVHVLSFLAAWLNPLAIWLKLPLSLCVLFSLWLAFKRHANGPEIAGLQLKPDESWDLHLARDEKAEARLLGSSIANPWFVLLHFKTENKRYSVLMPRDSLEPEAFRRLRVALKVVKIGGAKGPIDS
jgi:hypothetical protein